ncbi:hypothetical protein PLCT2_02221 [Planctomycetaceae bacterium]|nr:hypothetical protein PLCT2_02221 [Planctomycetaceae bacterium]
MFNPPKAYLITITGYGTRLHGDERGTVDETHNVYGTDPAPADEIRHAHRQDELTEPALKFDAAVRGCIERAMRQHCEFRGWHLYAINVRTNHVHIVVAALAESDKMATQFKAYATRALRKEGLIGNRRHVWTEGASKRNLFTDEAVASGCNYVMFAQGPDLPKL